MANFRTHIGVSTVVGLCYGAGGCLAYGMSVPASLLSAGLCSVGGILPDVDSDNGVPLRETTSLLAIVVPMLMLDRWRSLGWPHETIVLATSLIYIAIRFGFSEFLRRYTVHRGMWHSIPAAAIAGAVVYYSCMVNDSPSRWFKSGGVVLGYLTHLLLDEIYSVDVGGMRIKKSFGTALKFFGRNAWPNISTYGKLAAIVFLITHDPLAPGTGTLQAAQNFFRDLGFQPTERTANDNGDTFYDGWQSSPQRPSQNVPPPSPLPYYNPAPPYQNPATTYPPAGYPYDNGYRPAPVPPSSQYHDPYRGY